MTDTAQLALPLLAPAQAQKHVTVNEALRMLDALVQARVEAADLSVPPAEPGEGQAWIVAGPVAVNAWEGWEGDIAVWAEGGWLRLAARPGWRVWDAGSATLRVRVGAVWVPLADVLGVVGVAALADGTVPRLGVGAAADATNGLVFRGTNALFQSDGAIDATLNKAESGLDASLSFKTGYSARALFGLLGSDDAQLKVSADGLAFHTAFLADAGTGAVTFPAGLRADDGTAASPGIAFAADADTGLRRAGADQIGLVVGGVQRAVLSATTLQVDVPLTGTAVQSTASDVTVGRLVRLFDGAGVFGLGVENASLQLASPDDLNAQRRSGFVRYASTTGGRPNGGAGVALHVARLAGQGAGFHMQVAIPHAAHDRLGRRVMLDNAGAWDAWDYLYSQRTAVGSVAQSAGVPTGALIERGANANGEFARWADGTQICWREATANLAINVAFMGGFRSGGQTAQFAASFAAPPVTSAFPVAATAFGACAQGNPSTANWSWAVTAVTTQAAADRTVQLVAIGRWF